MSVEASGEIQLLIMMNAGTPDDQVEEVLALLAENGSYGRVAPGHESLVIGAFGDREALKGLGARGSRRRGQRAADRQAVQARVE